MPRLSVFTFTLPLRWRWPEGRGWASHPSARSATLTETASSSVTRSHSRLASSSYVPSRSSCSSSGSRPTVLP